MIRWSVEESTIESVVDFNSALRECGEQLACGLRGRALPVEASESIGRGS